MENSYILSGQISLYGEADCIGFGNDEFYIKEIQREVAIKTIIENHYSKKVYNGTYINLGVFNKNGLIGVLQYGYAMNPASCGSVDLFNQIYNFIEGIRQTTMNKETYDEAIDILKKMINEKV